MSKNWRYEAAKATKDATHKLYTEAFTVTSSMEGDKKVDKYNCIEDICERLMLDANYSKEQGSDEYYSDERYLDILFHALSTTHGKLWKKSGSSIKDGASLAQAVMEDKVRLSAMKVAFVERVVCNPLTIFNQKFDGVSATNHFRYVVDATHI